MKIFFFYPLFRPFGTQINFFRIFAKLKSKGGGQNSSFKIEKSLFKVGRKREKIGESLFKAGRK